MATVTSSRRRNERGSGSKKVAASTPKPRQTSVGNRGAQQGPLKPATRTSGTSLTNSNKPSMRQIQAKAEAARARAAGQPGIKGAIKLPNSARRGTNLPRQGANALSTPRTPSRPSGPTRASIGNVKGPASSPKPPSAANRAAAAVRAATTPKPTTTPKPSTIKPGGRMGPLSGAITAVLDPYAQKAGAYLGTELGNAMRPMFGKLPLTQKQKAWLRDNPGQRLPKPSFNEKAYAAKQGKTSDYKTPATAKKPAAPKKPAATSSRSTAPKSTAPKATAPKATASRKPATKADTEFSGLSAADLMKGYGMRVNQTFSAESPSKPKRQSLKEMNADIQRMIEESKKRQGKG